MLAVAQPPCDSHRRMWARPGIRRPWDVDTCRPVRKCPSAAWPQRPSMRVSRPAACPPGDDDDDCGCHDDDAMAQLAAGQRQQLPMLVAAAMAGDRPAVRPTTADPHWLQRQQLQPLRRPRRLSTRSCSSCSSSGPTAEPQWASHS